MSKYIIRLDDACEKMNLDNWSRMEELLDKYGVKPLVGVIPNCEDVEMDKYSHNDDFWNIVQRWIDKGWAIAMHGYDHVYSTDNGGINPVNHRSEFAGVTLAEQKAKIKKGVEIFRRHGIDPEIFFAPSHTFDDNTLQALRDESNVRIISDTIATKPYNYQGFTFVPQQSGRVRRLPFKVVTFCYHPNTMNEAGFSILEKYLEKNKKHFIKFPTVLTNRSKSLVDKLLGRLYFARRK